jgi:probable phosphoglycerate mutase
MSAARLTLARHAETSWNAEGRVQGQLDVPLSHIGHEQARALAAVLGAERFAALYASDLLRVRQTAEPAARALGLAAQLDARLRERHYGVFEGRTYRECKEQLPEDYARFKAKELDYDFRGGESLSGFAARSLECLRQIAARHSGEDVLVFTHGGVIEMAYRHATGRGLQTPRDFEIPNAALFRFEIDAEAWRVRQWADTAHLDAALDDLAE